MDDPQPNRIRLDIERSRNCGVSNGQSKLDDEAVRDIQRRVAGGESQRSVARRYKVAQPTIFRIIGGRSWQHVTRGNVTRPPRPFAGMRHGSAHRSAKLTEADVPEVRRRLAAGERTSDVARAFGVGFTAVDAIKRGTTWKHVPLEAPASASR